MKTSRQDDFSTSSSKESPTKRARIEPATTAGIIKHTGQMRDMPDEIWMEILTNLNKKDLRELAQSNSFFYNLITNNNLINKAPWPTPDYTKLLATITKTLLLNQTDGKYRFVKRELANGDIVLGRKNGEVHVLKLRARNWELFCEAPTDKDLVAVNDAILLASGHILTCGDEGLKIWDRENSKQRLVSHLIIDKSQELDVTRLKKVIELKNGDLITASRSGHIHIWKKSSTNISSYTPIILSFIPGGKIQTLIAADDVLFVQNSAYMKVLNLPLDTPIDKLMTPPGPTALIANNSREVKTSEIKNKIIETVTALSQDDNFASTYLEIGNMLATLNSVEIFPYTEGNLPSKKMLLEGKLVILIARLCFMVDLFNPQINPYFLGIVGINFDIKEINQQVILIRKMDILADAGTTPKRHVEILSDWDSSTHQFKHKKNIPARRAILLDDGSIAIQSMENSVSIYNRQNDKLSTLLPDISPPDVIMGCLKNNDLISGAVNVSGTRNNRFTILSGQSGIAKATFFSKDEEYLELPNGDLSTYEYNDELTHIKVHQFKTQ